MKKIVWITTLAGMCVALSASEAGDEHIKLALIKDYKIMFDRIGQHRVGADVKKIEAVKPPFVRLNPPKKEKVIVKKDGTKIAVKAKAELILQAIMNNRAKISGKWYRVGDKVAEYKLASVQRNGVFLQNNEYKKRLTLRKKNEKITIK